MTRETVLAVDLGAESGRVMAVAFDGARLEARELYRFANLPVTVRSTLYWDALYLWRELQTGLERAAELTPTSVGVDSWGVDFGLLDAQGQLIANPVHYRDRRTEGMIARVASIIPKEELFAITGIQFVPFNTLYQLFSLAQRQAPELACARQLLLIADLMHYWLCGEIGCEYTNATTTQLIDARARCWSDRLIDALGLPRQLFPTIIPPGSELGRFGRLKVIAPATHDTACAVVATPATETPFIYISSGTWSLVGTELAAPICDARGLAANLTNEGGVGNYRLLRNVMGLWIVQQCRQRFAAAGQALSYAELTELARQAPPLQAIFDVNDLRFFPPGDHPALIRQLTGKPLAQPGEVVRAVLESLALAYRDVIETITQLTGNAPKVIHIVGGGANNELLNQLTADATGLPVVAGPAEATALGNGVMQLIALGHFHDVAEARRCLAASAQRRFEPRPDAAWEDAYAHYLALKAS